TPSNSLIIAAPAQTMDLLLSLVKELDRPAAAQSSVKIFTLKKADAVQTATLLQQLFLSSGASLLGARAAGGAGGAGGVLTGTAATPPTGLGGAGAGVNSTVGRPLLALPGATPAGRASLVQLRISVDDR